MFHPKAVSGILWSFAGAMVLSGLLAGFVPRREGVEVRRRVNTAVERPQPADPSQTIVNAVGGWSLRAPATPCGPPPQEKNQEPHRAGGWFAFSQAGVSMATAVGLKPLENGASGLYAPVLPPDGGSEPMLLAAAPSGYGEPLNLDGRPLRWLAARVLPACAVGQAAVEPVAVFSLPRQTIDASAIPGHARRYQHLVESFSRRFGLNPALVYAIIKAESNFSPLLVSSRSAMGLMQLLPSTAGGEVHTFLHGRPADVSFEDLSNPEINIRYGTAYLYLLLNRHLADVRHPLSREYCAVASYNMGPNRFLRMFSDDRDAAIEMINAMTPEQVFQKLTTTLPIFETRAFVAKVTRTRDEFASPEETSQ